MAVEQDWAAYGNQNHLKTNDTLLARTNGGAGVEIGGQHILARRADGDIYTGNGGLELATGAGIFSILNYGGASAKILSSGGLGYDVAAASAHAFMFGGTVLGNWLNAAGTNACAFGVGMAGNPQTFANYAHVQLGDTANGPSGGSQLTLYGNTSAVRCYLEASATGFRMATSTTDHIIFRTNATDRMIIQSDGHVRPNGNNSQTFGTTANRWSEVWTSKVVTPAGVTLSLQGGAGGQWNISSSTGSFFPSTDNALPLGGAANRPSVIYAGSATINTSDAREKFWLRCGLTEAELRAGIRIFKEIGSFQWKDAIEEKGEEARIHFGVRAQAVWAIMAEEKLVKPISDKTGKPGKTPYAFLCYDKWDDEFEDIWAEVEVEKTRTVQITSKIIDPSTGQPAVTEMNEIYVEVQLQNTGKKRLVKAAGDRFGIRDTSLQWFLMAALAHKLEL